MALAVNTADDTSSLFSDPGYTGDTGYDPNSLTRFADIDYYRAQVLQFQVTMNACDATIQALQNALTIANQFMGPLSLDDQLAVQDAQSSLAEFMSKKSEFKAAAVAINAASQTADMVSIRFPSVSVPQTLQLAPAAIAAVAAAVALAAALVVWASGAIARAKSAASRIALIDSLPPDQKATAIAQEQAIAAAEAAANQSPLTSVANIVKWFAIGALIFFGYKAFVEFRRG